jgi:hypothetical protein
MAPPSHYVEVFELLDGGLRDGGWMGEGRPKGGHALAILPGLTHYNLATSPLFAAVTLASSTSSRAERLRQTWGPVSLWSSARCGWSSGHFPRMDGGVKRAWPGERDPPITLPASG